MSKKAVTFDVSEPKVHTVCQHPVISSPWSILLSFITSKRCIFSTLTIIIMLCLNKGLSFFLKYYKIIPRSKLEELEDYAADHVMVDDIVTPESQVYNKVLMRPSIDNISMISHCESHDAIMRPIDESEDIEVKHIDEDIEVKHIDVDTEVKHIEPIDEIK